jgi:hypothetical protein
MLSRGKGTRDMGYGEIMKLNDIWIVSDVASLNNAAAELHDMCFHVSSIRKKLGQSETRSYKEIAFVFAQGERLGHDPSFGTRSAPVKGARCD